MSFDDLATYQAERERGIVHTLEWDARMADLQREHDKRADAMIEEMRGPDGVIIIPASAPGYLFDAIARMDERCRREQAT